MSLDSMKSKCDEIRETYCADISAMIRVAQAHNIPAAWDVVKVLEQRRAFAVELAVNDHLEINTNAK